jgi:hypothetical protein
MRNRKYPELYSILHSQIANSQSPLFTPPWHQDQAAQIPVVHPSSHRIRSQHIANHLLHSPGQGPSSTTTCPEDTICIRCPSEAIYGEQSSETELLHNFRDNVLSKTPEGRALIKLYYLWSPYIVKAMEQDEEFKAEIKQMIDGVLPMIERAVE